VISALLAHSASATTRSCGNAPRSRRPWASFVLGPPKRSQFASVSCASSVVPSRLTTRRPRQNAPGVAGPANGPATFSNNSRSGSAPNRARAFDNASSDGILTATPRAAHASVPASLRITRPPPMSMNSASAST